MHVLALFLLLAQSRAEYVGGTVPVLVSGASGSVETADQEYFAFYAKGSQVRVPYQRINLLEYGQKVARRWRSAILLSPIALFHKARKHFVTITYQDKDKAEQAVVLEFDNDDIRMVLASLKARTLQTIVMQDEEAKKEMGGVIEKK